MSNSSEVRVSIIEESTPGVTPATPAMLVLPTTGQDLQPLLRYIQSNTITANRNVADLVRVSRSGGGTIPCEMRWAVPGEALYEAIRAQMCYQTEEAEISIGSCTATPGGFTVTRASGSFITDKVDVGDVVRLTGATPPEDNGYRKVTASTALYISLSGPSFTGSVGNVTVKRGGRFDNGTYHRHFTVEVSRLDVGIHHIFRKQVFNTWASRIATGSITTCVFGITGGSPEISGSPIGSSYVQPANRSVMDAIEVPLLQFGGVEYECTEMGVSTNNNAVAREKIGLDSVGTIRRGQHSVSGSTKWYYDDSAELLKFINNQSSTGILIQEDALGQAWSWSIPRLKYENVRTATAGPNQDDEFEASYQGLEDTTAPYTLRLQRFSA